MADNTQTQTQISALRTLQESYDALASAQSAQATSTALEAAKQAILNAIAALPTVAQIQNGLALQTQVKDGNDTAISVGKGIASEMGTSSDTASETGTLFATLKYTKNKTKDVDESIGDMASALAYIEAGGLPSITAIAKQGDNPNADISTIQEKIGTPTSGQQSTLFGAIANINIDTSDLAKQGTNSSATNTAIKSAVDALPSAQEIAQAVVLGANVQVSYDGVTYQLPYQGRSVLEAITNMNQIVSIIDNSMDTISVIIPSMTNLRELTLQKLEYYSIIYPFNSNSGILKLSMPLLHDAGLQAFRGLSNLRELRIPKLETLTSQNQFYGSCDNLILIECGAHINGDCAVFNTWRAANAVRSDISTLVNDGEPFANNLEKFLYNIRTYFAANLPDRTGQTAYTLTFHANVKAAIQADTATSDAFTNKNWTVA